MMELSNVRIKGITEYEKSFITCDVSTSQCDERIVKWEREREREREESLNVTKSIITYDVGTIQWRFNHQISVKNKGTTECNKSKVICDVSMELSNMREKKEGTIECVKSTIKCDVGTA